MKIRNGFVSNSSSSSFLVAFPKAPKSISEVQSLMLGKTKHITNKYTGEKLTATEAAKYVMAQIKKQKPVKPNYKKIEDIIYGTCFSTLRIEDFPSYSEYYEEASRYTNKMIAEFIAKYSTSSRVYVLIFGDSSSDDGGGLIENSDIFKKLPHIKLSNH